MNTIFEAFDAAARKFAAHPAICVPPRARRDYAPDGIEWTYEQALEKLLELSRAYEAAGYGIGHRVALLLDSRPDMVLHMYALNRLGASIVPVNPDYRVEETRYVLEHSEADLLVVLPKHGEHVDATLARMSSPPLLAVLGDEAFSAPQPRRPRRAGTPGRATEAAILYTSGTTAAPKGCIATNEYGLYAGERYLAAGGVIDIGEGEERLFNPLPLFYVNSLLITTMTMVLSGGCCIYPDRFHANTWWADIRASRATMFQYLGIVLPALYALPVTEDERNHQIRIAVGAGADPTMHAAFQERFGIPIVEVWGMTEVAIASIASREPRDVGSRSIGHPCVGMEFRVVDDADRPLPTGETGELVVRRTGDDPRRGLVGAYLKDAEATAAAWKGEWFHTGDLAVARPDGSFRFVDRKKDIIRRSGQNIAASEVEAALVEHPSVARAACIAAPDEMREEEVFACVVLKSGQAPSRQLAEDITLRTLKRLAYFKAPGWIAFFDSLPLTATQKLQKRSIFAVGADPRVHPGVHDLRPLKRPVPKAG